MNIKLNIISILLCTFSISKAQVGIDTTNNNTSALLDFAENTTKGIILPQVENINEMSNITEGTIVFDATSSKIK